jgi:hypothetical protein
MSRSMLVADVLEYLVQSRGIMFDRLLWRDEALKVARQRTAAESSSRPDRRQTRFSVLSNWQR